MMIRKLAVATGIAAMLSVGTTYAFGIPKLPGVPTGGSSSDGGVSADSVEKFIAAGKESSDTINKARSLLAAALSTKEERAKLIAQSAQIKNGLDAKDKKAEDDQKAFIASEDAAIKAGLSDQQRLDSLKTLSADQRKQVATSALSIGYGILLQKQQVDTGKSMIGQIGSNPMLATKLPAVKDTVTSMVSNLSGTAGYIGNLPSLFKSMGVSVQMPTSTDQKPAEAPANVADVFKTE